jgi:RNA polymerase sigma factor (sigma-70 family)
MAKRADVTRLARLAREGDRAALDEFLAVMQPVVVRAVRLVVGPGSTLAEDSCQEALLDIARGLQGLDSPDRAVPWVMRVAMRRAVRAARRQRLRAHLIGNDDLLVAAEDRGPVPGRLLEIREAFDALPTRVRAVAVLRIYVGFSEAETAEALGCSLGTVKSRLHTARKRLQTLLSEEAAAPKPLHPARRSA